MKKEKEQPKSLAQLGGEATLKKYGAEHYRKMVNKRWRKARAKAKAEKALSKK
jgi:hypothetical protein